MSKRSDDFNRRMATLCMLFPRAYESVDCCVQAPSHTAATDELNWTAAVHCPNIFRTV